MNSIFSMGFGSPAESAWMGQASSLNPTATKSTETSWLDILNQGVKSTGDIYGSYGDIKEAEASAEGKEAEAALRAANERTLQTMQQTNAIQQALIDKQNQIMGIDKTVFFVGLSLLGLGIIGGGIYLAGKK